MRDYILRRLLLIPITLFGISVITFSIIRMAPGDPAQMKVSPGVGGEQQADKNVSKETYEATLEQFDLDKPVVMQYLRWVGRLCGIEVRAWSAKKEYKQEVKDLLIAKLRETDGAAIASRRGEIEAQIKKEPGTKDLSPADLAAKIDGQLDSWIQAQAMETRFRYGDQVSAIRKKYRDQYGEDFETYFTYAGLALNRNKKTGRWYPFDFGRSFKDDREVIDVLLEKIPKSLKLSLISIFLAYIIAIPLGIHSSVSQGKLSDRIITTTLFVLYSLPSFWVAIMLLLLVSKGGIGLKLFPVGSLSPEIPPGVSPWSPGILLKTASHYVLPVFCLTYASFAYISRQMRAGMLEVVRQDFIRTARAKGLPEHVVILKHALRNSLIPIITIVAVILPSLVGGSVIIETIFNIDGIGRQSFTAILTRDYPIIMAIFTMSALLTLLGILISDVLYAIVDPQISFEGK